MIREFLVSSFYPYLVSTLTRFCRAGADLLRTKVFSERYGFAVDFESERCGAIPRDRDMCPGAISACEFVKDKSECALSGGSTFSVRFPRVRFASNGDASPESQTEGASSA